MARTLKDQWFALALAANTLIALIWLELIAQYLLPRILQTICCPHVLYLDGHFCVKTMTAINGLIEAA